MKSTRKISMWKKNLLPFAAVLALVGVRTASAVDYPTTILADNPLGYYRLEETSGIIAADSSASHAFPGNYVTSGGFPFLGWPGIDTNGIAVSASQFPNFDYVSVGYYPEFNAPGPFSFEVWARPISTSPTDYRCPIGNSAAYSTATQSGWYVYQTPAPGSTFAFVSPNVVFITSPTYTLNSWYYLAGTFDGTNMSFYVNGVLVGTQAASTYVPNSVNNVDACTFSIGQRGAGYGNFDGELDEAAYYTNALTLAQIQTHYQAGTNMFRSNTEPPLIFTDPAAATVNAGQVAQFSVLADGAAPLTYQWYKGTSQINGATNAVYGFTTANSDDGTTYSVAITNAFGGTISTEATLAVTASLEIVAPLTSIVRNAGSSAAFEIVVKGAGPITYQWHNGDTSIIPGATNSVLWLYNVPLAADGSTYYVSITNPSTSIDSDPATLNVQARPVNVPISGYANVVVADGPIAFWQLNEPTGSGTAVDTVGSFDGTYLAGAGSFTFGVPSGIPHDTNSALGVTGGATVSIPYAIEINPPVGSFTWEGWFNPASLAANGNDYRTVFCSMSNPYGAGNTGWLVYQTFDNHWAWWPRDGFYNGVSLQDNDLVVANQWYYMTLVYDGTTFTFYVNGVAKASGTDSTFVQNGNVPLTPNGPATYNYNYNTTPGLPVGSGATVFAWRNPVDFQPFSGTMDNIAVYNKALNPSQILNHFQNTTHVSISSSGNNVVISWPVGTLQSSTVVSGPFVDVVGAISPYTNSVSGTKSFFRVRF
jgi:Concanavalin A-like lectin/glucanases superfamily